MKKVLLLTSILALMLVSANPAGLVRLTLINKSGMEIAIQLHSKTDDLSVYYLPVPAGDKINPAIQVYTILRDSYYMQLYYIETYDPVYGFKCYPQPPNTLIAVRNLRVTFLECDKLAPNPGEPSMVKYLPVTSSGRGYMVTTKCAPLLVRFGIIRKCWQLRYIY
jgi:hypothetical protein